MILNKPPLLLLLLLHLIFISSIPQNHHFIAARPLSLKPHQGHSETLATIGVVCKCCDGVEGACRSTWEDSCSNLQCSPWKYETS